MSQSSAPVHGAFSTLDKSGISRFQLKIMFVSGMGFFTDAYDLFVIGIVVALLKPQWNLSTGQVSLAELRDPARVRGRRARLRPGRGHARAQEDLRLRGADPRGRRDRFRLRAELHLPAGLPDHPRHRHRRRLPGLRDDHERVLGQAVPGPDGRPGVRDAGRRPDRRTARRLDPARVRRVGEPHLAAAARPRRHPRAGGLLPAPADPRDAAVRDGRRRSPTRRERRSRRPPAADGGRGHRPASRRARQSQGALERLRACSPGTSACCCG